MISDTVKPSGTDTNVSTIELPHVGTIVCGAQTIGVELERYVELPYSGWFHKHYIKLLVKAKMDEPTGDADIAIRDLNIQKSIRNGSIAWLARWRGLRHKFIPVMSMSLSAHRYGNTFALHMLVRFTRLMNHTADSRTLWTDVKFNRSIAYLKHFALLRKKIGKSNKPITVENVEELTGALSRIEEFILS